MQYKARCTVFDELILMCESTANRISYLMQPLTEIMQEIESSGICRNLTFLNNFIFYLRTDDFPVAWTKAVYESDMPLKKQEKDILYQLGISLGSADRDVQINILNYYNKYFISAAKDAQNKKDKYSNTSLFTWCLCGSAVLIIFI